MRAHGGHCRQWHGIKRGGEVALRACHGRHRMTTAFQLAPKCKCRQRRWRGRQLDHPLVGALAPDAVQQQPLATEQAGAGLDLDQHSFLQLADPGTELQRPPGERLQVGSGVWIKRGRAGRRWRGENCYPQHGGPAARPRLCAGTRRWERARGRGSVYGAQDRAA